MKSMDIVKDILQTFPGVVSLKTAINVAKEIIEEHGDNGLEDCKTSEPFGPMSERVIELKYYQRYLCDNCLGDGWCQDCGAIWEEAPPEPCYLQIWLNDSHELCWG